MARCKQTIRRNPTYYPNHRIYRRTSRQSQSEVNRNSPEHTPTFASTSTTLSASCKLLAAVPTLLSPSPPPTAPPLTTSGSGDVSAEDVSLDIDRESPTNTPTNTSIVSIITNETKKTPIVHTKETDLNAGVAFAPNSSDSVSSVFNPVNFVVVVTSNQKSEVPVFLWVTIPDTMRADCIFGPIHRILLKLSEETETTEEITGLVRLFKLIAKRVLFTLVQEEMKTTPDLKKTYDTLCSLYKGEEILELLFRKVKVEKLGTNPSFGYCRSHTAKINEELASLIPKANSVSFLFYNTTD